MDIISEGELGREKYYAYFEQHIVEGNQKDSSFKLTHHQTAIDYEIAKKFTDKPLKITLPGPLTLAKFMKDLKNIRKISKNWHTI